MESTGSRASPSALWRSFTVYLWPDSSGVGWRVFLEDSDTCQRLGFANLESMLAFLQDGQPSILTLYCGEID